MMLNVENRVKHLERYLIQSTNIPIRLWHLSYKYASDILSMASSTKIVMSHRTPFEALIGYTLDISGPDLFQWYQ